jgi:hypothetical protein
MFDFKAINWGQAFGDGIFTFGATIFAFGLALWHDRKKQAELNIREQIRIFEMDQKKEIERKHEEVRIRDNETVHDEQRLQVLLVALLREFQKAYREFKVPSYLHPRAFNLYETLVLENTAREQLELIKNSEALKILADVRPNLLAFKYYYLEALKYYPLGGSHNTGNQVRLEKVYFDQATSQMQTMQEICKQETRTLSLLLLSLCPYGVPQELAEDQWRN